MEAASTWRELLENITQDTQERQRIARELGVSIVTLSRWVHNTTNPRIQSLHRLIEILPQYRSQLQPLILAEFPEFMNTPVEDFQEEAETFIPSTFYARVFDAYTTTPRLQRFWTISNLILQQALEQLDPHQLGMAIIIVQCMPPWEDQNIYSLRERAGHGTKPWSMNLEQQAIFLGEEALAGNIVSASRPLALQNRKEYRGIVPAHWVEWEESAAGYPLLRSSKIAGCLLVSSTQPNYFVPYRTQLIQYYAELLAFVLEPEEFYDLSRINLRTMPYYTEQKKKLVTFRSRVANLMAQSLRDKIPMNLAQAEHIIWQQIEKELLLGL
ncbi:MAG: helix-turn-helix transcriptional regulator [Ktedonobacteraceae bacterium]|nr:helix-turn-helix transcriptional regulator [Ktedonobacteraceae bacterium]